MPFEDVLLDIDAWPSQKAEFLAKGINLGTVPYIELPDGRIIGEHVAAMKYIARRADPAVYPVEDPEKQLLIDELCDLNQDYRLSRRVPSYADTRLKILELMEGRYANNQFHGAGPYLLGEQISVCDHFLAQTLQEYPCAIFPGEEYKFPELCKLMAAFEARPGVMALRERQKDRQEALKEMYGRVLPHLGQMLEKHLKGMK